MANRVKEDEKNERIIRSLLKLPENRRCINCNSLGPQYVCTNFSIFICTTCSGIHREFTHRVKSVSMAKFTLQEVSALQGGGNASAKEIYFKEWDPQRHSIPDSSNVERLRDFIKHVYVDRRYTGEKSLDKPPRSKMGETDFSENRKVDTYQVGSRILPYEDTYERRYSERPSPGGRSDDKNYRTSYDERRSPGSDSDYRSPARTEIVNDWRRDDRFGNGRRSEDSRISDGGFKLEVRSPDHQRDLDVSSPPVVRPVRDILGENVSPLRIIEPPKPDGGRLVDSSVHTQSTVSSSSLASSNGNHTELRMESSLIDFDAVPEPPLTTALPNTQQTAIGLSVLQPTSSFNDNWANFDSVPEVKVSQAPSNSNLLESVLSELSVPAPSPSPASGGASITQPVGNMSVLSSSNSFFNVVDGAPWHTVHPQQHSLFPATGTHTPAQPFTPSISGASSNQAYAHLSQLVSRPAVEVTSGVVTQPSPLEVRPTGKKELPEDLFSAYYSSFPASVPGWQSGLPQGIGFNMQYNIAAPMPTFPQPSRSTNPFDFNNDPSSVQAPMFPSMASLQGALPNTGAPTGLLHTSSIGTPSQTWMPPHSSHVLAMPPQAPSYASAMPPSSYIGQQVPPNMQPRQQGVMSFGIEQPVFGSLNLNQHQGGLYSAPATPNTFSVGGNPFG